MGKQELSILSSFLLNKVKEKGWSKKEFAEQSGLSTSYAYELLSDKRDAIPSEDILEKVSVTLELAEKESAYVLALGEYERKLDKVIYLSDDIEDLPEAPGGGGEPDEPEEPPVEPDPDEPAEPTEPDKPEPDEPEEPEDPVLPPEPEPDPQPPAPVPDGAAEVSWGHRKVITALVIGLIGGLMIGCCSASTIVPVILSVIGF